MMSGYLHDKALEVKFHRDLPMKDLKSTNKGFWKRKLVEFCKRTDLHGFKYIVMEDLSSAERTCWAIAVFLSTVFATYFVITAYKWYARNPIVTVIESTQGAIWDIPFPAITICDLNTVSRKGARIFSNNVTLPPNVTTEAVFDAVQFAPLLHSPYVTSTEQKQKLRLLQNVLDFNKMTLEVLFHKLSPAASCNKMLQRCMWKNTIYHCDELFQQIMTMYKLCCTFNYFAVSDDATEAEVPRHQKPRRVASCGYQTALTVLLRTDPGDYYSALVPSQGALVFIDDAYNLPNTDSPTRMVSPSTELLIALSPERTYTTKGIRAFSPAERQCIYKDEVKITGFRQYSLHNCVAYQRIEVIKKKCDCVPFYFPNNDLSRVCDFNDLDCLEDLIKPHDIEKESIYKDSQLTCLPECEHYDYPVQVAMGRLATNMKLTGLPFYNNVELANCSLLNVFFNDLVSTRFRRDVYFNWQNFTAAFGGLLSLMLGFTMIAFLDMVIFFTIRLVYETLPKKTTPLSGNEKKINNWLEKSAQIQKIYDKDYGIRKHKNVNVIKLSK